MIRVNNKTVSRNNVWRNDRMSAFDSKQNTIKNALRNEFNRKTVGFKTTMARKQCYQFFHYLEKDLVKISKTDDSLLKEECYKKINEGLDKSAVESIGRFIAEIKQLYLAYDYNKEGEILEVELDKNTYYNNFEKFCEKELKGISIEPQKYDELLKLFELNILNLKKLGEKVEYLKPAKQFEKNLEVLKTIAIQENDLLLNQ